MNTIDKAKLSELDAALANVFTVIEDNIQEINNVCGL